MANVMEYDPAGSYSITLDESGPSSPRITPRFFAVGAEVTEALSTVTDSSRMGDDLAGKKSSVLSGFSLRWLDAIHSEMSARHAEILSSTWVAEGGKERNSCVSSSLLTIYP